jgi:hypothetical protein
LKLLSDGFVASKRPATAASFSQWGCKIEKQEPAAFDGADCVKGQKKKMDIISLMMSEVTAAGRRIVQSGFWSMECDPAAIRSSSSAVKTDHCKEDFAVSTCPEECWQQYSILGASIVVGRSYCGLVSQQSRFLL